MPILLSSMFEICIYETICIKLIILFLTISKSLIFNFNIVAKIAVITYPKIVDKIIANIIPAKIANVQSIIYKKRLIFMRYLFVGKI